MFPTFTGNARAKRQVNLSGRTSNPFSAYGSSNVATGKGQPLHGAVAQAQYERALREQERRRPPAAILIQRTWRGHRARQRTWHYWRREWDNYEGWNTDQLIQGPYRSDAECLQQLRLLAQFASPSSKEDVQRIDHFASRLMASKRASQQFTLSGPGLYPAFRLSQTLMAVFDVGMLGGLPGKTAVHLLDLLANLVTITPDLLVHYSTQYYYSIRQAAIFCTEDTYLSRCVLALLSGSQWHTQTAYAGFASELLTQPLVPGFTSDLSVLARSIEYSLLTRAMSDLLRIESSSNILSNKPHEDLLWLLAHFIYFNAWTRKQHGGNTGPDARFVQIVSSMITFLAKDIQVRLDVLSSDEAIMPLPAFVKAQLLSLIDQSSVSSLLTRLEYNTYEPQTSLAGSDQASTLASYALTLLTVFPKRKEEIQLWLYRGSTSANSITYPSMPATKFFYLVASSTSIFNRILQDPHETVILLRPKTRSAQRQDAQNLQEVNARKEEWRIILLFLELYSFILKVMDDEEFLAGSTTPPEEASWTRKSALPLKEIEKLTSFLKNLAFSLYYNAAELAGVDTEKAHRSLAAYFGKEGLQHNNSEADSEVNMDDTVVGGMNGMTLSSVKGLVTGVLRMLYERDSRRKFLPKDHWLMTRYFEMDRFINAVVEEEEHKHQIEESYEETSGNNDDGIDEHEEDDSSHLVGTARVQQIRQVERLKQQQRRSSRKKYLESVTPRLKILENMPFFIPFQTRVQIFRQFIALDQLRRRGTSNPDEWRFNLMNSSFDNNARHQATVRRDYIVDDAFKAFYTLGEGLKEPIQIRFMDRFDTMEEGIDGGGVTKEFLTSITNEAFKGDECLDSLFAENDQHLLYPNPCAVEERKENLRSALYKERSPEWNGIIRDLLQRYDFLGRIIGKCLYEGILLNIQFAPFFLIKWALTGGPTLAGRETSYRANLNDLRDLDEGLYQGLLQLKNYSGNVENDFSLNFTVTDTLRLNPTQTKTVTSELRPDGDSIPVTNENRLFYIAAMANYRLQRQPYAQTSAFLKGLGMIISPSWLSMFNQSELQTLLGGSGASISVSDLRRNTQYGGVYAIGDDGLEHPTIQLFWKVLEDLDDADVAKALKFVTSTPRAPLLGFAYLEPRFSIRDSGSDQTRLPTTSTCVNLLKLPIYREEKVLKERLLYSINSGAGFNLS